MKKIIFGSIMIALIFGASTQLHARSYPITTIINEDCSTNNLPCTYPLPHIEDANYLKYQYEKIYRETYSMLRGTTYYDGRDIGMGGHQGIDIATASGTEVFSVADGEVIFAGEKGGRGKTITIKHIQNNQIIYSSYAHLSAISVNIGDKIKEGNLIGKVGSTGNSTGPHLHFQIEINQDNNHPFFYRNCKGETYEIVNEARCEKQMHENTTDPILFIEKKGKIPLFINTNQEPTFNKNYTETPLLGFSGRLGGIIDKNNLGTNIQVSSKINTEKTEILNTPVTLSYDKKIIKIIPDTFQILKKTITIIPQKTGFTMLTFSHNNKVIKKIPVLITDPIFLEQFKKALEQQPTLLSALMK